MEIFNYIVSIIGGIIVLCLFIFAWKYFKYRNIITKMNKLGQDELIERKLFKEISYNRFISDRKVKLYKKLSLIFLLITISLMIVVGGASFSYV